MDAQSPRGRLRPLRRLADRDAGLIELQDGDLVLFWFISLAFDAHTPGLLVAAGSGTVYVSHDYGAHFSTLPGGFDFPSGVFAQFYVDRGRIGATGSGSGAWTYRGDLSGLVE